jgi:Fe2+ or Zn2+ uptake regulation protein
MDLIFANQAKDRGFFVSEMVVVASEGSTLNVTEDWGSLLADTLSLRVLQSTEYKMKQSTPAGFDQASNSELEMLARLRNYKTANQIRNRLREIGLRTTRKRVALGNILFAKGNRHISAEMLFEEANQAKFSVSLATVYNTLHQFTEAGLLRQVEDTDSHIFTSATAQVLHQRNSEPGTVRQISPSGRGARRRKS